ncbi:hypothetical protein GUJ93_ZPchr0002g26698 [Zizania palustris]|uniref:Uncharacterized protein n=1 Tax=Zizania palustris TaxID=103762 RepID=A0A8J5V5H8_ZIZPA|nr:hypothetical protein GUJ93_ZPchr0002g26698 [Zizania palustris]
MADIDPYVKVDRSVEFKKSGSTKLSTATLLHGNDGAANTAVHGDNEQALTGSTSITMASPVRPSTSTATMVTTDLVMFVTMTSPTMDIPATEALTLDVLAMGASVLPLRSRAGGRARRGRGHTIGCRPPRGGETDDRPCYRGRGVPLLIVDDASNLPTWEVEHGWWSAMKHSADSRVMSQLVERMGAACPDQIMSLGALNA